MPRNGPCDVARVHVETDVLCEPCGKTVPAGEPAVRFSDADFAFFVCCPCAAESTDTLVRRLAG
jgi:hypothetical protein